MSPIKFTITPRLPPPYMTDKDQPQLNMSVPHSVIHARLTAIGYADPGTSIEAMVNTGVIVGNLRMGKLMISRRATDANGVEGIFTAFVKK